MVRPERLKRDRAQRRCKKSWIAQESSELEGRSLSDSDLQARQNVLIREAWRTLETGKELGLKIRGSEQDVIEEISLLEEAELSAKGV
ncbi:hypothetical protein V6N13_083349 [Hibiscus sabdariffa]